MWKQQVALRNVLGDPWPTMVAKANTGGAEDRMTLVEAMAEASRMGNPSGRGRDEQARREIAEQTMLTGTVSAQAASTLIADARARAQNSVPRSPPASGGDQDAWRPAKVQKRSDAEGDEAMRQVDLLEVEQAMMQRSRGGASGMTLRTLDTVREEQGMDEESKEGADIDIQLAHHAVKQAREIASAKAERNKVETEAGGPKVELQGGSYAQPFVASGINVNITGLPSNSAKSTRASSSPAASSPSKGRTSNGTATAGHWGIEVLRDGDTTLTMPPPANRDRVPVLSHASLFATIKQFRGEGDAPSTIQAYREAEGAAQELRSQSSSSGQA